MGDTISFTAVNVLLTPSKVRLGSSLIPSLYKQRRRTEEEEEEEEEEEALTFQISSALLYNMMKHNL